MLWGPCTAIILEAACRVSMFFSFWFALAGPLEHCLCTFKAPFLRPSSLVTRGSFGNVLYSLCFAPFPGDLHDSSRHQAAALLFEPRDWKKVLFYSSSIGDDIRRISQCSATRKQSFHASAMSCVSGKNFTDHSSENCCLHLAWVFDFSCATNVSSV